MIRSLGIKPIPFSINTQRFAEKTALRSRNVCSPDFEQGTFRP